jgi:hypothetical protein
MSDLPLSTDPWLGVDGTSPNVVILTCDDTSDVTAYATSYAAFLHARSPSYTFNVVARSIINGTQLAVYRS